MIECDFCKKESIDVSICDAYKFCKDCEKRFEYETNKAPLKTISHDSSEAVYPSKTAKKLEHYYGKMTNDEVQKYIKEYGYLHGFGLNGYLVKVEYWYINPHIVYEDIPKEDYEGSSYFWESYDNSYIITSNEKTFQFYYRDLKSIF